MNEPVLDRLAGEPRLTLGKRLIRARKARGWTLGYVASQLHLPESTIEFLESDDYTQLPAEVYIKGYLRNYARLLRIPADEILQGYVDQRHRPEPSADSFGTPRAKTPSSRTRRPVSVRVDVREAHPVPEAGEKPRAHSAAMGWATLALIAALSSTWWWPEGGHPWTDLVGSISSAISSSLSPGAPTGTDPRKARPAAVPQTEQASSQRQNPLSDPTSHPDASLQGAPIEGERSVADVASREPTETPVPYEPGVDTLTLRFEGDSWATAIDAEGKRLIHQTGVAGTTKILRGKAPFNLTIGRLANVSIEFNGQSVALPNARNRATERFTVPLKSRD